jgi:glutamate/tyrosine decarboxylase-like PLP-dependent enzyme
VSDAREILARAWDSIDRWEVGWGPFERHPALDVPAHRLEEALDDLLGRLTAPVDGESPGNYPFFHPRYAGQMLKPPHPVAVAAYAAAMRINPNNHALDGGPPSAKMERELMADLAAMFELPPESLGHLTGGGTVANLEALWVARESHPGRGIAFSEEAHYTHSRMASVLGLETAAVAADDRGRMDLDALEETLRAGRVGTVVLTAATTGLGAVDPIAEAIPLAKAYGARVHVDAAYGGFFRLLADAAAPPAGFPVAHFLAIRDADSVAIDPHKHGLQPYGCGAVLFRDPAVSRVYLHDSPYTYFTSGDLHLGEISLECSRPGAAAAALWLTLRALPLRADDGLGPILAAGLRAARDLASRLDASERLDVYTPPETDIVVYAPRPAVASLSALDAASQRVFDAGMSDTDDPVFLSLYRLDAGRLGRRFPSLAADAPAARVLRSVLMKPEHEHHTGWLAGRLEALAAG